jgi:hypothetical protein
VAEVAGRLAESARETRKFCEEVFVSPKNIALEHVWSWGPALVARHFWDKTGLERIISASSGRDLSEIAFALSANRLVDPRYGHGMDVWTKRNFVPARDGTRLDLARLRRASGGRRKLSGDFWDNAIQKLAVRQQLIEESLLQAVRDKSGDGDQIALYELHADFVEGVRSRHGLSAVPAQRNTFRLFLGAIMWGDWPVAVHLFGGSEPTGLQVKRLLEEAQRRFKSRRVLVVFPPGVEEEKVRQLESLGFCYLVGVRRRRDPKAVEVIRKAKGEWVVVDDDRRVQEVYLPPETDVPFGASEAQPNPSDRYFLVHSRRDQREERAFRAAVVQRSLRALEELKQAVESRKVKDSSAITERAERILGHSKSYRYISWRLTKEGQFQFWEDKEKSLLQRSYEGISLLKTNNPQLSATSAVRTYDRLRRLEEAFDTIYDARAFRATPLPLPELEEHSSEGDFGKLFAGHLLISQLAFSLRTAIEGRLSEKKVGLSFDDVVEALGSIVVAKLRIGRTRRPMLCAAADPAANKIAHALGIEKLNAPTDAA